MRPVVVDFHTHIYPDGVAAVAIAGVRDRAGVVAYTDGTARGLLCSMQEAGIDLSIICSIATKPSQVTRLHQWLQDIRSDHLLPLATTHPEVADQQNLVRTLKASGFQGFKLHPDYQGFFIDDARIFPFYEAAEAEGMFILFHTGLDLGLPTPMHGTPRAIATINKVFPYLRIVAAHMGGLDVYQQTEEHLLGTNVYFDTSFVLQQMPLGLVQRFFDKHPIERFLFASDSPWRNQTDELRYLRSLPFLTDNQRDKILGENAMRLLHICNGRGKNDLESNRSNL
jgi:hypothetical protein